MLMLGANLVWTAYNSLLLPMLVEGGHKEWERLGNRSDRLVLAIIVSLLSGILIGSLIGLPLIGLPTLLLAPALQPAFLSLALPVIILSYCGMQFATNVGNGAWWPLLVDVVPEHHAAWLPVSRVL